MTASARGQAAATRWDLEVRGSSGIENGELRIEGSTGRILLEHDDSAFQALYDLRIADGRISFRLPRSGRFFEGTVSDTSMRGTILEPGGGAGTWFALPMRSAPSAQSHWPVPPRVTFRQLLMGTSAVVEHIPGSWLALTADTATTNREYRMLAAAVAVPASVGADRGERARRFALGLDAASRDVARAQILRIAQGSASSAAFRRLFGSTGSTLDFHDAAFSRAPHYLQGFQLTEAGRGLRLLGELGERTDTAAIRESGWRLWSLLVNDSATVLARIDSLTRRDGSAGASVRALLGGYDEAIDWWRDAVRWLLTNPWLQTDAGPRSPAQLMAAFWGVDSLPLPEIRPTGYGDAAAMPIVSALHIGSHLVQPQNASAAEWLAHGGMQAAFDVWLPIRWGEIPLVMSIDGRDVTVVSPAAQAQARPSAFFGDRDAIRIDPGIMPIAAVATFLHEWHHLITAQRRLSGAHPAALIDGRNQLQLLDDDPWLAEGFAEWATEETLRPAGQSGALLRFTQAEKRAGIADRDPDDPHVLGYRLVRGVTKGRTTAQLRDLLVANLHDLAGMARRLGLPANGRTPGIVLHRPANAAVIPAITFTWAEGTMFDLSRRLVIPNPRSEH